MSIGNVRCKRNCGNSIKRELVDEHDGWEQTDEGGWLCPVCNPESDVSWESDE